MMSRVVEMPANHVSENHQHPWGQLAYASRGIMRVDLPGASYIIPPERALWMPKFTPHQISNRYGLSFRSLYIDNALSNSLPTHTTAINVDNLLRELILQVASWGDDYQVTKKKGRLIHFLLDQIEDAQQAPLYLNMPKDKRLLKISNRLNQHPGDNTTLEQWGTRIGATPRTINRIFNKETHMGFVQWRQRLRILYSLDKIEQGENMESIALGLGYESSSAFITMFKKHLGSSPKRYFKDTQNIEEGREIDSLPVYRQEEPF
jgi:AraC-like DNA-binding protein